MNVNEDEAEENKGNYCNFLCVGLFFIHTMTFLDMNEICADKMAVWSKMSQIMVSVSVFKVSKVMRDVKGPSEASLDAPLRLIVISGHFFQYLTRISSDPFFISS